MVWRCREFFFSNIFGFYNFFDQIFFELYYWGHFCISRNKMLCPEDRRPLPGGAVHFLSAPLVPPPRSPPPSGGGAYKFPGFGSRVAEGKGEGKQRCSNTPQDPGGVGGLVRAGNIVIVRFSASCGNQIELMSAT